MKNSKKAIFLTLCTIFSSLPVGAMEKNKNQMEKKFEKKEENPKNVDYEKFCGWLDQNVPQCILIPGSNSKVIRVLLTDLCLQKLNEEKQKYEYNKNMTRQIQNWIDTMIKDIKYFNKKKYEGELGLQREQDTKNNTLECSYIINRKQRLIDAVTKDSKEKKDTEETKKTEEPKDTKKTKEIINEKYEDDIKPIDFNHLISAEGGSKNYAATVATYLELNKKFKPETDIEVILPGPDGRKQKIIFTNNDAKETLELGARLAEAYVSSDSAEESTKQMKKDKAHAGVIKRALRALSGLEWECELIKQVTSEHKNSWDDYNAAELIEKVGNTMVKKNSRKKTLLLRHVLWSCGVLCTLQSVADKYNALKKEDTANALNEEDTANEVEEPIHWLEDLQRWGLLEMEEKLKEWKTDAPNTEFIPKPYALVITWGRKNPKKKDEETRTTVQYKTHWKTAGPLRQESEFKKGGNYDEYSTDINKCSQQEKLTILNVMKFVLGVDYNTVKDNVKITIKNSRFEEKELGEKKPHGKGQKKDEKKSRNEEKKSNRKKSRSRDKELKADKSSLKDKKLDLEVAIKLREMLPEGLKQDYDTLSDENKKIIEKLLTLLLFCESLRAMDRGKYVASVVDRELGKFGKKINSRYKDKEMFKGVFPNPEENPIEKITSWRQEKFSKAPTLLKEYTEDNENKINVKKEDTKDKMNVDKKNKMDIEE